MSTRYNKGFSLIEALVALVVMGFGMLGVLGIQSSLRQYSDISKQRSEAVRLAQEKTEAWRAFVKLDADAGVTDYNDITTHGAITVMPADSPVAAATNTTYTYERIVGILTNSADMPQYGRWLQTTLRWNDRTGAEQRVDFHTHITGVSPEFAGTLVTSSVGGNNGAGVQRRPLGRHPGIPRGAVDDGTGSSNFAPPGLPSTVWTFDNATGLITRICNPTCTDTSFVGYLLSGYVRVSDPIDPVTSTFVQPTGADAESPYAPGGSAVFGTIGVEVAQTAPTVQTVVCATQTFPQYVAYYCAMPATVSDSRWSGRSTVTGPVYAADAADPSIAKARTCRYTPQTVDTPSPPLTALEHPDTYSNVRQPLISQDFLVIRAGDGTAAFTCPGDDTTTPYVNGNTYRHQPAS